MGRLRGGSMPAGSKLLWIAFLHGAPSVAILFPSGRLVQSALSADGALCSPVSGVCMSKVQTAHRKQLVSLDRISHF